MRVVYQANTPITGRASLVRGSREFSCTVERQDGLEKQRCISEVLIEERRKVILPSYHSYAALLLHAKNEGLDLTLTVLKRHLVRLIVEKGYRFQ